MEDTAVTDEDVIRIAQAAQRDRRELIALLSDVADSVVTQHPAGGAVAHLNPALFAEIQRRTTHHSN